MRTFIVSFGNQIDSKWLETTLEVMADTSVAAAYMAWLRWVVTYNLPYLDGDYRVTTIEIISGGLTGAGIMVRRAPQQFEPVLNGPVGWEMLPVITEYRGRVAITSLRVPAAQLTELRADLADLATKWSGYVDITDLLAE